MVKAMWGAYCEKGAIETVLFVLTLVLNNNTSCSCSWVLTCRLHDWIPDNIGLLVSQRALHQARANTVGTSAHMCV